MPLKTSVICESCLAAIPVNQTFFCATCAARLPDGKKTCHRDAPCLIGGAASYANPTVKELVRQLKFKGVRDAADPLASLLANYLKNCVPPRFLATCVMIPVPLSKRRLSERGFNQAEEIAERLTMTMTMTMKTDLLVRTRNTKPQTEMRGFKERLDNLSDCFAAISDIPRKNILLVDDVTTSGTTFCEAARTLKAAGAGKIIAVAAAKA